MKAALIIATLALLPGAVVTAQTPAAKPAATPVARPAAVPAANPCPTGNYTIVRSSKIKPGGSIAGFRKAVADNVKWYADHGYKNDRFTSGPLIVRDATGRTMLSPDVMVVVHTNVTSVPLAGQDATWKAYLAEYSANTTPIRTTIACIGA